MGLGRIAEAGVITWFLGGGFLMFIIVLLLLKACWSGGISSPTVMEGVLRRAVVDQAWRQTTVLTRGLLTRSLAEW